MVPWGSPIVIGTHTHLQLPCLTNCFLSRERSFNNHWHNLYHKTKGSTGSSRGNQTITVKRPIIPYDLLVRLILSRHYPKFYECQVFAVACFNISLAL